jgi:hypothetical protein
MKYKEMNSKGMHLWNSLLETTFLSFLFFFKISLVK